MVQQYGSLDSVSGWFSMNKISQPRDGCGAAHCACAPDSTAGVEKLFCVCSALDFRATWRVIHCRVRPTLVTFGTHYTHTHTFTVRCANEWAEAPDDPPARPMNEAALTHHVTTQASEVTGEKKE